MAEDDPRIHQRTTRTATAPRPTENLGSEQVPLPASPDLPGVIGDYEVRREIARGGMGRIVEALDRRQDRLVALKLLLRHDGSAERRFQREARITGRLQHPAIVPLYEAGRLPGGEPFFAMKLVRGESLAEVLRTKATTAERLELVPHLIAMTEALAYAHGEGIIHRDLKPSNVLIGAFGETVVIDWGLAKVEGTSDEESSGDGALDAVATAATLTAQGNVIGTPSYMPPEQARGEPIDARADVYALGACMYHALSGRMPYEARTARELIARLLSEPPKAVAEIAPELPGDLVAIVAKAMARDRDQRYATAKQMAEDLRRFSAGRLVSAHVYSVGDLVRRWVARHRAVLGVAAAAVVVLAVLAGIGVRRIARERDRAQAARVEADAQRGTAVAQRDAAEKLIASLVGDLRTKLVPIGRVDVMSALGDRVLEYYRDVPAGVETTDPSMLLRRAEAIATLAGAYEVKYERDAAVRSYREALSLAKRARELGADVVDGSQLEAKYLYRIGLVMYQQGDLKGSVETLDASITLLDGVLPKLVATGAGAQAEARRALAMTSKGQALTDLGHMEEATALLTKAIDALARLRESKPGDDELTRNLAWAYQYRTQVTLQRGDLASALDNAERSLALRAELTLVHSDNAYMRGEQSAASFFVSCVDVTLGQEERALHRIEEQIPHDRERVKLDSTQAAWLSLLGDQEALACIAAARLGRVSEALVHCKADLEDRRQLVARAPDSVGGLEDLADALERDGLVQARLGRLADAMELLGEAAPLVRDRNVQGNANICGERPEPRIGVARAALAQGHANAALIALREARDALNTREQAKPGNIFLVAQRIEADVVEGDAQLSARDTSSALAAWHQGAERCSALMKSAPSFIDARLLCAEANAKLAAHASSTEEVASRRQLARSYLDGISTARVGVLEREEWYRAIR